jgi:hypothetical protein
MDRHELPHFPAKKKKALTVPLIGQTLASTVSTAFAEQFPNSSIFRETGATTLDRRLTAGIAPTSAVRSPIPGPGYGRCC